MRKPLLTFFVSVLAFTMITACDKLTEKRMGVAILTEIPSIADADPPLIDDRLVSALGTLPIEASTIATIFIGERPSLTDTEATPTAITGATCRLAFAGRLVTLSEIDSENSPGTYMAYNGSAADMSVDGLEASTDLEYLDVPYAVYVDILGDYYELSITAPQAIDSSAVTFNGSNLPNEQITFPAPLGIDPIDFFTHTQNQDLTVAWESENPDEPQQAFITLFRVEYNGASDMSDIFESSAWQVSSDNPVFNNFPADPESFLNLVLESPETSITLPGSLFTPGYYIMALTVVEINSENDMAIGSAGIAGVATPFAFLVKP